MANAIVQWPLTASANGALTYESVEELMMVDDMKTMTPQVLYGYDLNHDGVIDANENNLAGGAAITNGTNQDSRGFWNYVTTYTTNATPGTAGTAIPTVTRRGNAVSITPPTIGLINVNTASQQVLMSIPGLSQTDAQTLIDTRTGTQETGTAWVTQGGRTNQGSVDRTVYYRHILSVFGGHRRGQRRCPGVQADSNRCGLPKPAGQNCVPERPDQLRIPVARRSANIASRRSGRACGCERNVECADGDGILELGSEISRFEILRFEI